MEQQVKEQRKAIVQKIYAIVGVGDATEFLGGDRAEEIGALSDNIEAQEREYLEKLRTFLLGQDFMRLGHCIQGGKWNLVLSNSRKLKDKCTELGITCFDRYLDGMRGAARGQNTNEAIQLMSRITEKRVQLRKLLTEEGEV